MNQDWEKWGKDIRNIVQDAIDSQDYEKLNQTISYTVADAVNNIQKGINSAGRAVNHAVDEAQRQMYRSASQGGRRYGQVPHGKNEYRDPGHQYRTTDWQKAQKKAPEQSGGFGPPELFKKGTSTKVIGITLSICGYTFSIGLGIAIVILAIIALVMGNLVLGIKITLGIIIPLFLGSTFMAWKGSNMLSAVKRYQQYISNLRGRTYCNLQDLAAASGRSAKYVMKDVTNMIRKGWFRQGHLDEKRTCLIVSHETFHEYQQIQRQQQEQAQLERQKEQEKQRRQDSVKADTKMQKVLEEGNEYIHKIRECNEAIPGEEISQKISRMETLVRRIFERVEQDPGSIEDIHKLMEYYLPTTVKLLEAYEQLDSQPVQGENIMSSKREIEQTLNTLNMAFEKLLDSLFEDVAWDVSTDISVLQTMLAQEGLTKNDFKGEEDRT